MTDSYNFFNLRAFSEADQPYACNDWVVFQEKAYKSRKPNNNRHPHDSDYWDEIGLVSGLLDHLLQDNRAIDLSVAFYPECSNGCVAMFDKGGCVIDKVPVLNEDGTQKKDDCGQLVFELMIFTSLIDCNTDAPQEGASKDDPTWDGGYTVCAYLNRPVAYTQDGNAPENWLKPEAPQNLKCVMDCSAPDGETIALAEQGESGTHSSPVGNKLRVIHDNKSIITTPKKGLEVAVIGKSISGEPVDVREDPCLVTCNDMGNGLWHNPETNKFEVKPADHSIIVDSEGVRVKISDGLELTDNGVNVKAADDSIEVTQDGVFVKVIGVNKAGIGLDAQDELCLVTCNEIGDGLIWNEETKQWDVDICGIAEDRNPDTATRKSLFCDKDGLGSTPYEHCDIATWSSGTIAHIVKGSDNKYYKANPSGKPSISDPVTQNIGQANWFGGYATMCELQQRHFGISAASGNLLQWREDGAYYGIEAPPNVAVQYVDALNGVDEEFTASGEGRGTRALPVKTIKFALDRLPFGSNGSIFLHESQDHYVNDRQLRSNNITFNPYGDVYDSLNPSAYCPGIYVVVGSYRYRNFKPRIVAKRCDPLPDIQLSETYEALAPAPSYKFSAIGIVLVSGDAACATSDKPISVYRSSFGGWGGITGGWDLDFSEVWLHTIAAFNGDVIARGTLYIKRLTSAQTPLTVKSPNLQNISIPYNLIDRPALPPVPVSPCDTDYSGIQDDIDIPSLFAGFGDPQEMVVGLSTNIPNSVIRP